MKFILISFGRGLALEVEGMLFAGEIWRQVAEMHCHWEYDYRNIFR